MEHEQNEIVRNQIQHDWVQSDSFSSLEATEYLTSPITFPQLPPTLTKLYEIYKKNSIKMAQLASSVDMISTNLTELERIKEEEKQCNYDAIEVIEEIEDDSPFIFKYFEQCKKREEELKSLAKTYTKLKMLTIQASLLQNQKAKQSLMNYVQTHRSLRSATITQKNIIFVVREKEREAKEKMQKIKNIINRSSKSSENSHKTTRKGKLKEYKQGCEQLNDLQQTRTIRILDTAKILFCLKSANSNLQPVQQTQVGLLKVKDDAQTVHYSIIFHIFDKIPLLLATYDEQTNAVFAYAQDGTIYKFTSYAQVESKVTVESALADSLELFEVRKGQLFVGTGSGIMRIYDISKGKFELSGIFGCCLQNFQPIKNYYLLGQQSITNILFTMNHILYCFNLQTFEIIKIYELEGNPSRIINNAIISSTNIREFIFKAESKSVEMKECVPIPNDLEKLLENREQIVYFGKAEANWEVLVYDTTGNIKYIKLE